MKRFTEEVAALSKEDFAVELVTDLAWWQVITIVMMDLKEPKSVVSLNILSCRRVYGALITTYPARRQSGDTYKCIPKQDVTTSDIRAL